MLSKILAAAILVLFISISFISSAFEINNKIDEKSIEYPKKEIDENIEIISFIRGTAFSVDETGLIFNKQIHITPWKTQIYIIGIKKSSSCLFDILYFFQAECIVKVNHFFGNVNQQSECSYDISGLAIGDIECYP
jgi:hypothetical protein